MAHLKAKFAEVGDLNRPNMAKLIDPKVKQNFDASWGRFVLRFNGLGEPSWIQVGSKIHKESMSRCTPFSMSFSG